MMSNEDLFRRFQEHADPDALAELFVQVRGPLLRTARSANPRGDDPEDLVQETLLAALLAAPRFDPQRDLLSWLRGILLKKCSNNRRSEARHQRRLRGVAPQLGFDEPGAQAQRAEAQLALRSALASLPKHDRVVLEAYYWHHSTPTEIARQQGREASTVRSQVARSLVKLRQLLPPGLASAAIASLLLPRLARAGEDAVVASTTTRWPLRLMRRPLAVAGVFVLVAVAVVAIQAPQALAQPVTLREPPTVSPLGFESTPPQRTSLAAPPEVATDTATESAPSEGRPVGIEVRDRSTDHPVPHLLVALGRDEVGDGALDAMRALAGATTDANGIAVFPPPARGTGIVRFGASSHSEVIDCGAATRPVIEVERVVAIAGAVVEENGRPAVGAEVWAVDRARNGMQRPLRVGTTDAAGAFRFSTADVECVGVFAKRPGAACSAAQNYNCSDGMPQEQILTLEPAHGVVAGVVYSATAQRTPVTVVVHPAKPHAPPIFTTADENGHFSVDSLPEGRQLVVALDDDGASVSLQAQSGDRSLSLMLVPSADILGRVEVTNGESLSDLAAVVLPSRGMPSRVFLSRCSSVTCTGDFYLRNVPSGDVSVFLLDLERGATCGRQDLTVSPGARTTVNVATGRARFGSSDVLDGFRAWIHPPDGDVPPGTAVVDVKLEFLPSPTFTGPRWAARLRRIDRPKREHSRPVVDRAAAFDGLIEGDYWVDVFGVGGRPQIALQRIAVRAGSSNVFAIALR